MRRPAPYHPHLRPAAVTGPVDTSTWAHPYPTGPFNPVFYNDGGTPAVPPVAPAAVPPAVPTPADLAHTTPATPATAPSGDEETVNLTQRRLNVLMKNEKDEGRRAALRQIAEAAGLNPEDIDLDKVSGLLKTAQETARQKMSDVERREADAQAAQARADQAVANAAARTREAELRIALAGLGCTGDDLRDATALLNLDLATDADEAAITQAATALKARRAELFGAAAPAANPTTPPAPGGNPAGGPPPRQTPSGKPGDRGREMARIRGHLREAS